MKAVVCRLNVGRVLFFSLLIFAPLRVDAGNQPGWGTAPTVSKPVAPLQTPYVPGRPLAPVQQTPRRTQAVTWEGLWRYVLNEVLRKYPIEVAGSVKGQPVCQVGGTAGASIVMGTARPRSRDDLGISRILVDFTRSIEARRYGDATRLLGLFQDRLLCVNERGLRALDLAMGSYLQQVGTRLPPRDRDMAFRGAFNPALLVLDQVLYTGGSWTLPILYGHRAAIRNAMRTYAGDAMGLWLFDYRTGALIRRGFDAADHLFIDGLFSAISRPGRFGNGACSILEMAATGFNCGGIPGLGGGGGGGGAAPVGPGGMLGCMTQAALTSGMHGQLSCMVASAGSGRGLADPTPELQMNGGLLDQMCARSDNPDGGAVDSRLGNWEDGDPTQQAPPPEKAPGFWEKVAAWIGLGPLVNGEGQTEKPDAGASDGGLRPGVDPGDLGHFDDDRPAPNIPEFDPNAGSTRTVDGGGGGCGDPTAAARRMASLFNCSGTGNSAQGGSDIMGGQNGTGPRSMPAPGSSGGMGGAPGGGMSGPGTCSVQNGSKVQVGLLDKRCQQSMVGPGESCAPEKATAEMIQRVRRDIYNPNRAMTGAKDPLPTQGRTGTGINRTFNRGFQNPAQQQGQER